MNERLIEARKRKGYTQRKIATLIEVDRSTYAHYERGRMPQLEKALRIAKELDTTVEVIFDAESVVKLNDKAV